jgi:putative transposase
MARGIEGGDIFRCDEDRCGFLKRLAGEINKPDGPRLYARALMTNHFHLLLRPGKGLLSPMMRRLMTGRSHTSVREAIMQARLEQEEGSHE